MLFRSAIDGFPNFFFSCGPNAAVGTGSLITIIQAQIDYIVKAADKMQREHLKSIEVKRSAVEDFVRYTEVSGVGPWKDT